MTEPLYPDARMHLVAFDTARVVTQCIDISDWADIWPTTTNPRAEGQVGQMTTTVYQVSPKTGALLPVQPIGGMELVYAYYNVYGAGLHEYHFTGKLVQVSQTALPSGLGYLFTLEGWDREQNAHTAGMTFQSSDPLLPNYARYETDRLRILFENSATLQGEWNATSYVFGPYIDYQGDASKTYPPCSVYDIVAAEAYNRGADGTVLARRWHITGEWKFPLGPYDATNKIVRKLNYYAQDSGPQELIPLTDRDDLLANYASDAFTRSNSTTTLGTSPTGHVWIPVNGSTWGITSNAATLVSGGSGFPAAVLNVNIADATIGMVLAAATDDQRLIFRATLGGTGGIQAFFVRHSGASWELQYYDGSVANSLASWLGPANIGDDVRAVLTGSTINVLINGIQRMSVVSATNQTATRHGISKNDAGGSFGSFYVQSLGMQYLDWRRTLDYTGLINAIAITSVGAAPFSPTFGTLTRASSRTGGATKTDVTAWAVDTIYNAGDFVRPTRPDGYQYRAQDSGRSHLTTEPVWSNIVAEGGTIVDNVGPNSITWVRDTWNASAESNEVITEDGGYVIFPIEETLAATDNFERVDNSLTAGKTAEGKDWTVFGQGGVIGIQAGRAYVSARPVTTYGVVNTGIGSSCIVQLKFADISGNPRLAFRASDDNNLYYVEAVTGVNYRLVRRQNGVETVIDTEAVGPATNDIIKVSCSGSTIQWYRSQNGGATFSLFGTIAGQAFNQGATFHGFGRDAITTGTPRFDDFRAWESYGSKQFGLNLGTLGTDRTALEFSLRLDGPTRRIYVNESGVEQNPTEQTVTIGDQFKIEAIKFLPNGQQLPYTKIRYYKKPSGQADWGSYYFESGANPQPTAANPFKVGVVFYDVGTSISSVSVARYTYSVHTDPVSIGKYGWFWHKGLYSDDNLDTFAKRDAKAKDVFARYAFPRDYFTGKLLLEYPDVPYHHGRRVLVNNSDLGWIDTVQYLVEIGVDRSALRSRTHYEMAFRLGASPYEFGDDEPLGQLLRAQEDDRIGPDAPIGLQPTTTARDGVNSVSQTWTWQRPTADEQYLDIELEEVLSPFQVQTVHLRWDANIATGTMQRLIPDTLYRARFHYIDRNGNPGTPTEFIEFLTAGIPRLPAPTTPQELLNVWSDERGAVLIQIGWGQPPGFIAHEFEVTITREGRTTVERVRAALAVLFIMAASLPYTVEVAAVDEWGAVGYSVAISGTSTSRPATDTRPYNGGFELLLPEPNTYSEVPGVQVTPKPDGWTKYDAGTGTFERSSIRRMEGSYSLLLTAALGDSIAVQSRYFTISELRTWLARRHYNSFGNLATAASLSIIIEWENEAGSVLHTWSMSAVYPMPTSDTWNAYQSTHLPLPTTVVRGRVRIELAANVSGTGAAKVYIDAISVTEAVPPEGLIDFGPGAGAVSYPSSVTLNAKGQVEAIVAGTAPPYSEVLSDFASSSYTLNPEPATPTTVKRTSGGTDMSVSVVLAATKTVEIELWALLDKDPAGQGRTRVDVTDNGTNILSDLISWSVADNSQYLHALFTVSLGSGTHVIKFNHESHYTTAQITWNTRLLIARVRA